MVLASCGLKHDSGIGAGRILQGKILRLLKIRTDRSQRHRRKTPMFRLSGIPHSGFQFRWVIADSLDRRYLMRAESGQPI
jgi:hypothetical protein